MRETYRVELIVHAPIEHVRKVGGSWATISETADPSRTNLVIETDSLDWPVLALSALGAEFEVVGPPEFAVYLRDCGERFARCA
jgi:predicted DNA-binding transcriptional regulator YafY